MFELESLRRQLDTQERVERELRMQIEEFEGQKQFFDIVRMELSRYRTAVKQAFDAGLLIKASRFLLFVYTIPLNDICRCSAASYIRAGVVPRHDPARVGTRARAPE